MSEVEPEVPQGLPDTLPEPAPEPETPPEPEEDVEVTEEPETPPEPAPPAVDDVVMEKFFKSLNTRVTTFNNWLSDAMGEQANDLSPCPLCADGIMGHIYPVEWIEPTSELQARLLEVLRRPVMPEYQRDPNTQPCGVCQGLGMTKTGSQVPGKTERVCRVCKGTGYLALDMPEPTTNGAVSEDEHALPVLSQPLVTDDTDNWGHPKYLEDGMPNPNWGRQPQYVDPAFP